MLIGAEPPELSLTVVAEGDVYDAPIGHDGSAAAFFDATPIRYPVGQGSGAIFVEAGTPVSEIAGHLSSDDVVVVLEPGIYEGDIVIEGRGVLLFGEGFSEGAVTIDGSIDARGEQVRLRGLTVTGSVAARGNDFGMSFIVVHGTAEFTGNGGAFIRNVFCSDVTVPSSNATLLGNYGIAPLHERPEDVCSG